MKTDERLKPCPFCGRIPTIYVCDEEGNIHDDDYENDAWSGLSYAICHDISDMDWDNVDCPIATDEYEILGTQLYDSIDELVENWNKRI